jgi:hypothetical protein
MIMLNKTHDLLNGGVCDMKYAIKVGEMVMETFDTPMDAYEAAICAYEETEVFHEVVVIAD